MSPLAAVRPMPEARKRRTAFPPAGSRTAPATPFGVGNSMCGGETGAFATPGQQRGSGSRQSRLVGIACAPRSRSALRRVLEHPVLGEAHYFLSDADGSAGADGAITMWTTCRTRAEMRPTFTMSGFQSAGMIVARCRRTAPKAARRGCGEKGHGDVAQQGGRGLRSSYLLGAVSISRVSMAC